MKRNHLHWLGSVGSAFAAVVPSCPLCAAASGGLLSSAGLGFVAASGVGRWLVPFLLGVGVVGLVIGARRHGGWWILGLGAAGAVVLSWAWLKDLEAPFWVGAALLATASGLNLKWRRRRSETLVQIGPRE